jgi:hypothetical protein
MSRAEDKGSGPVGKAAGSVAEGHRLENAGVGTGGADVTGLGVNAVGDASDFAEDHAQGTAKNVGGFAGRKEERLLGNELEP